MKVLLKSGVRIIDRKKRAESLPKSQNYNQLLTKKSPKSSPIKDEILFEKISKNAVYK